MYAYASLPTSAILLMTVVDSPGYISHFTNLRHLTLANIFPRGPYGWRACKGGHFKWVHGAVAALQSPITHLTIEILIHQPADLNFVDWKALDMLLSTQEVLRSLVQVSVVFLGKVESCDWDPKSIAHPVTIRRLMPLTSMMGLLTISTRGPKL